MIAGNNLIFINLITNIIHQLSSITYQLLKV